MKNSKKFLAAMGLATIGTVIAASQVLAGSGSTTSAISIAKAPVIDGAISAGEYPEAGKVTYFDASANSDVKVTFYTAWDDANLYFAAKVADKDVVGDQTEMSAPVWQDDDLEIYLDATNEGKDVRGETDFQFLWGAANGLNMVIGDGTGAYNFDAWRPGVKTITKVLGTINNGSDKDEGFIVEAAFPWKDFGLKPKAGLKVGFNVTSFDYASDPRTPQISFFSWQPEVDISNNHVPEKWGTLVLK